MPSSYSEPDILDIIRTTYPEEQYPDLFLAGKSKASLKEGEGEGEGEGEKEHTLFRPIEDIDWVSKVRFNSPHNMLVRC